MRSRDIYLKTKANTIAQRREIYARALRDWKVRQCRNLPSTKTLFYTQAVISTKNGFCHYFVKRYVGIRLHDLPELMNISPMGSSIASLWFKANEHGRKERCELLRKAIKECDRKININNKRLNKNEKR